MNIEDLSFDKDIFIKKDDTLIVIDIQNDFIPGGAFPVEKGDEILDTINEIIEIFKFKNGIIVLTQDWHPSDHMSFASNHPNKDPGDEYQSNDGAIGPVLWPDHCVQGTIGAMFHKKLNVNAARAIIRKGIHPEIDSYSAFLENDRKTETGLSGYLKSLKTKRIFLCGLALDYCCYFSAMDATSFGFETYFIVDLTKGIDLPQGSISDAFKSMKKEGIKFTKSNYIH
ncbi:MAG: bifunctional nicotinamidase/pyrazinamidase [Promethearchaeota archaeon]